MRSFQVLGLTLMAVLFSGACIVAVDEPVAYPRPVPSSPPLPPIDPTVGYFYDSLDPWGEWVWSESWGWVWTPGRVQGSWRPYREGQWIWTANGWYWLSDEPWAWATYHYGRWSWVPRWGWVWVPGDTWAPAWVAWRWGGGWAGWAPLPPEVLWMNDRLYWDDDIDIWIDVDWWCFVQEVHFVEPRVHRHAVPVGRNVTLVRTTKDRTRYLREKDHVVSRGPEFNEVRRAARKEVPTWRITDVASPGEAGRPIENRKEIRAWRARLAPPKNDARPVTAAPGRISKDETDRQARRRAVPTPQQPAPATPAPQTPPVTRTPPEPRQPPAPSGRPERVTRPRPAEIDMDAERARLAREQAAEQERLANQQAEEARRTREEQERKARADREAVDARARAELAERQRLERERAAEARRAADEGERRAVEQRAAEDRRQREAALAREREAQQRADADRRARAEADRKALEQRQAEERRVQRERAEQERRVVEERAKRAAERAERETPRRETPEEKQKKEKEKESEPPPPQQKRLPR